jgi:hypothetical protein
MTQSHKFRLLTPPRSAIESNEHRAASAICRVKVVASEVEAPRHDIARADCNVDRTHMSHTFTTLHERRDGNVLSVERSTEDKGLSNVGLVAMTGNDIPVISSLPYSGKPASSPASLALVGF